MLPTGPASPSLLIASPNMIDPFFQNAVVLLLEQDDQGAYGFVLNNKSKLALDEVISFQSMEIPPSIPVWNAGPVDGSAGFVLHNKKSDYFEREIAPGVSLSSSQESLLRLIENARGEDNSAASSPNTSAVLYPFRLLVGYAGWLPGQLEAEIQVGSWIKAPLDYTILFNATYCGMWQRALAAAERQAAHPDLAKVKRKRDAWLH